MKEKRMPKSRRLRSIAILMAASLASVAARAEIIDVTLDPSSTSLQLGDIFTVDIIGAYDGDISNPIIGGSFDVLFDAGLFQVTDVAVHAPNDLFPVLPSIDNLGGTISDLAFASFFGGLTGTFNYATVTLSAAGVGTGEISVQDSDDLVYAWANLFLTDLSFTISPLTLTISDVTTPPPPPPPSSVPEPSSLYLIALGLVSMAIRFRLSRRSD